MTRWGIVAGTPQYMSPEQAKGEPLDGRSDLFSLGCVLYEMATGVSPFRTDSAMATMRRLVDESPQALASLNPELPPWFIAIVDRLLEKEPSRRFGSAKEVSQLLEGCLAHIQQPATVPLPAALPKPVPQPDSGRRKSRLKGVIAMFAILGISLLGGIMFLSPEPPDIAGQWTGEDWGSVVLKQTNPAEYTGTYSDTFGKKPGAIHLKWSPIERRFTGTWREGEDRFGELSLRLVNNEIRGALTTDAKSRINPATPRLADLTWVRAKAAATSEQPARSHPNTATAMPKRGRQFQTGEKVETLACSADGTLIAIAHGGQTFPFRDNWKGSPEILNAETGKTVVSLQLTTNDEDTLLKHVPTFEVEALAFSPDGNVVAIGTSIGQVKLFNARTGELARSLDDKQAKLADKKTPAELKSLTRAMGSVASLAFSPDGSLLAMCGSSFEDFARNSGGVRRLGELATGPGRLKVWEVKTGALKHDLVGHSHANVVAFSPNGNWLASAGSWLNIHEHGTGVIIWNPETGEKLRTMTNEANGGTHAVAFSPNSKLVVIGARSFDKDNDTSTTAVSLAHALTGIMEWQQTVLGWANPKAFSPDGKSVAVLCRKRSIQFLDTETGEMKHEIRLADSHKGARWNDFAIMPQGHMLAIGGIDAGKRGFVTVWDLDGAEGK
jgi:WD40 repeat protein